MQVLPYYLAIGMTYDEFWYGDAWLVKVFEQAHEQKISMRNQEIYLQGLYNFKAFRAVIEAFSYGLGGCKGSKPEGYFEYPIPITEAEKEAEKQRKIKHTYEWIKKSQKSQEEVSEWQK